MIGILNVNKPSGMTSRAVVDSVERLVRGVKIGHAGTLDPLATGVLVLCLGKATRLIESIQAAPKTYRTVIRLGARSETLDADGDVIPEADPPIPTIAAIEEALATQVGTIVQQPPEYSALKIKGKRAYELARAGLVVALEPRLVRIDRVTRLDYHWPRLTLEIVCGGGTYIRSIARDLGAILGCGGLVEVLTRTAIGGFTLEAAVDLDALTPDSLLGCLNPALMAVPDLPRVDLDEAQLADVLQGRTLISPALSENGLPEGEVALIGPDGRLAAIAGADPLRVSIHPRKVFI